MGKRRARGEGSLFKAVRRGKEIWIGRRIVGHRADGKPVIVERWGTTQREVVQKLADALPPGEGTTVAQWAARWLKTLSVRTSSLTTYTEDLDNHILPAIGHLPLVAVRPSHLETLTAAIGKVLHVNTTRKVLGVARALFAAAVREELIARNPATIARRPSGVKTKIKPFTTDELRRIIAEAPSYAAGPMIAMLAGVGCRLGEASALDVADWDPGTGQISITKTYNGRYGMGPPKSRYSTRTITVPAAVRAVIESAIGNRTKGPIFQTKNSRRYKKPAIREGLETMLKRVGIPFRNPHQLRHSVATAMISAGVPLGDVAKYLGDTVQTVVSTYLHAAGTDPALTMDAILGFKVCER